MNIKFLVSSDIHGFVFPYTYADKSDSPRGFLKIVSYFRKHKDENTIVIDNGDLIQGSPLLKYNTSLDKENIMVYGINSIYDYVNVGNHDFNWGSAYLNNYLNNLKAKCVCGNVIYKGKPLADKYTIKTIGGKKIAIIGVTSKAVEQFEGKDHLIDTVFIDEYKFVREALKEIKDVDLKVVVYHGGLNTNMNNEPIIANKDNQGYEMCRDLDFDILISGHQHRTLSYYCFDKLVCQCASDGKEFISLDYNLDTKKGDAQILIPDNEIDEDLLKYYQPYEDLTQKYLDIALGKVNNIDLTIDDELQARIVKAPIVSLINQIQLEHSKAMLSSCALFNGAKGFKANITYRDLINTYNYPNFLVTLKIDGKTLKLYLEKCAEYFDIEDGKVVVAMDYVKPVPQGYNYDMVDGIDYVIKASNARGNRITSIKYQGNDVKDDDIFTLCVSNFRASGACGFDMLKGLEVVSTSYEEILEIIADYISKYKNIDVKHTENIKIEI